MSKPLLIVLIIGIIGVVLGVLTLKMPLSSNPPFIFIAAICFLAIIIVFIVKNKS